MTELVSLGDVMQVFQDATEAERSLIVGATARDLILHHVHGLRITRRTVDLDIAVAVRSWNAFRAMEEGLINHGAGRDPELVHRFLLNDWKLDLVPFGHVERGGFITWPETESKMTVAGFAEASTHAVEVRLPGDTLVAVASPPALLMLKLIAWEERHVVEPRLDAVDIRTLIDSYAESWNEERLYDEGDDLLQRFDYDNRRAGAALLGRDSAAIAQPATLGRMIAIVERETTDERLILAKDMSPYRIAENLALLEALASGFEDVVLSRP